MCVMCVCERERWLTPSSLYEEVRQREGQRSFLSSTPTTQLPHPPLQTRHSTLSTSLPSARAKTRTESKLPRSSSRISDDSPSFSARPFLLSSALRQPQKQQQQQQHCRPLSLAPHPPPLFRRIQSRREGRQEHRRHRQADQERQGAQG